MSRPKNHQVRAIAFATEFAPKWEIVPENQETYSENPHFVEGELEKATQKAVMWGRESKCDCPNHQVRAIAFGFDGV